MQIIWTENNGSFLAYRDGKYCGMASQTPNDSRLMNPGKWQATWHTEDGGISFCGDYDTEEEAKEKVEIGLSSWGEHE